MAPPPLDVALYQVSFLYLLAMIQYDTLGVYSTDPRAPYFADPRVNDLVADLQGDLAVALGCSSTGGSTTGGGGSTGTASGCMPACGADAGADGAGGGSIDPANDPACKTAQGGLFTELPESCVNVNGISTVIVEKNFNGSLQFFVCTCPGVCPCNYVCGDAPLPPSSGFGADASVNNVCVPK